VQDYFVPEMSTVANALVIPLGKSVSQALQTLAASDQIDLDRCLLGFPHPSGANGGRTKEYNERKDALATKARDWFDAV
jgi:hypothetical protein